jgi:hypothetical protein
LNVVITFIPFGLSSAIITQELHIWIEFLWRCTLVVIIFLFLLGLSTSPMDINSHLLPWHIYQEIIIVQYFLLCIILLFLLLKPLFLLSCHLLLFSNPLLQFLLLFEPQILLKLDLLLIHLLLLLHPLLLNDHFFLFDILL